mmetsp:Transcript_13864/g.20750  ORF Transcript_13864/g.20750 Transcript_13864/m.20750 type:complete len:383 (-) Transcript_13864:32-1180(-)
MKSALKLFSVFSRQKLNSIKNSHEKVLLVGIGMSHFCERARWMLDQAEQNYVEHRHCPAFHLSSTIMVLSKFPKISFAWDFIPEILNFDSKDIQRKEKSSVPKLVIPINSSQIYNLIDKSKTTMNTLKVEDKYLVVYGGSSGISRYVHYCYKERNQRIRSLYMDGQKSIDICQLESFFINEFAPAVTAWSFGHMLLTGKQYQSTSEVMDSNFNIGSAQFFVNACSRDTNVNFLERLLFRLLGVKVIVPLMIKANNINAIERDKAWETIKKVFIKVDSILAQQKLVAGRQDCEDEKNLFLLGTDLPTAADFTFAAFCMPLLLPVETKSLFASIDELEAMSNSRNTDQMVGCAKMASAARELISEHPSARFALALYRNHRHLKT